MKTSILIANIYLASALIIIGGIAWVGGVVLAGLWLLDAMKKESKNEK